MIVSLFLIATAYAAKLTQTLDNTQAAFEHQIADLLVGLNYDSKHQTQEKNQVTRRLNRRLGMKRKLSVQRRARPNGRRAFRQKSNRSKHVLTQRRSAIQSLVSSRIASKRNQIEENRILSSTFLV